MIFEFEDFELDTDLVELRRQGRPEHVEPQVFDVLRYLVEHRDRVVSKEELLDNVWGDRFVSESALTSRIKAARQATGDSGKAQRVIGTVHGRGYRFLAPVTVKGTRPLAVAPASTASALAAGPPRRDVRYTRAGTVNIAYEVTGDGPIDIVLVPGFVSHLEYDWEDPRSAAFLDRLGSLGRLIRFDKRGTGLSDRPAGLPDLEARMDDVRAVMDAVGSESAVIFGYSEGGPMAALFAATYPARTRALVLYGTYAKRLRSDDYPWAPTAEEREAYAAQVEAEWGWLSDMQSMCPNADAAMAEWWQRRARAAASPGAARALVEMNSKIDIRDVLPTIHVPTIVLHRTGDPDSRADEGRYIAQHIPGAGFVELDGVDHVPWIDAEQILTPIEGFIRDVTELPPRVPTDRALAATLFTDIVGSTGINAFMGDARWSALLDRHDHIVREVVDEWQGRWVKSTGDGVLAVFDGPARALRAAVAARHRLADLGIRIRAGVHASEIEQRGDDIAGLGVAIAARLVAMAEPGDVLATSVVRDLISGSGIELVGRGNHQMKGVPGTWDVWAVAEGEPSPFRAVAAPLRPETRATASNLPLPNDTLLGRDDDVARVTAALTEARVVTLAGPGGVGKTRLAVECAALDHGDVRFVDLSRVIDPAAVAGAFLDTFGISPRADAADVDRLVETLELRQVLLVVDNCEQVLLAVADIVSRLSRDTGAIRVLATSRQALGVNGEQVIVVAPLTLPSPSASSDEQREADAVRMFVDRVERTGGTVDDVAAIVELCWRLDGIPLALELAAARTRAFSPAQILEQLDAGWSVSVSRRDAGPAHHLSLDDAIDWSFQLLDDDERVLLLALSLFNGSFDLTAVAAVAGTEPFLTADRIAQLVDKSLVQSVQGPAGRRFRLLETVRAFASARLDPDEAAAMSHRHAAHFAAQVDMLGARIPGPEEEDALSRLSVEFDDVHAAFVHSIIEHDLDTAVRLARGPRLSVSTEGARWAHLALQAVELPGVDAHPEYVSLLASAAWGAVLIADLPRSRRYANRGIEVLGDPAQHPRLCWIQPQATAGSYTEGAEHCVKGAAVAGAAGDKAAESFLLGTAAIYRLAAGDERGAVEVGERARELAHEVGSRSLWARASGALTYALQDIDATQARIAAYEVLEIAQPGDFHLNMPHRVLATLAWRDGDSAAAAQHAAEAASLIRDQGDRYVQAASMRQLAVIVGDIDAELAAELIGVSEALVPELRVIKRDEIADSKLRAELEEKFGADAYAAYVGKGRRLDVRAVYSTVDRALRAIASAPRA